MYSFDQQMILNDLFDTLRNKLNSEVVFYYGTVQIDFQQTFSRFIIEQKKINPQYDNLSMIIKSNGGSGTAALRVITEIYKSYKNFNVYINDRCFSAGTMIALCSNQINMTSFALLSPIDSYLFLENGSHISLNLMVSMYDDLKSKPPDNLSPYEDYLLKSYYNPQYIESQRMENKEIHSFIKDKIVSKMGLSENKAINIVNTMNDIKFWKSHFIGVTLNDLQDKVPELKVRDYTNDKELDDSIYQLTSILSSNYLMEKNHSVLLKSKEYHFSQTDKLNPLL